MHVDYVATFRVKTGDNEPPTLMMVQAMLTLALMRTEVWLTQEQNERGDLEIELSDIRINDWDSR